MAFLEQTMGLRSRRKGKRGERQIVNLARAHGLTAERTWTTSQSSDPTERRCDVTVAGTRCQVKVQADGFNTLYDALAGVQAAFLKADRREWLVTMRAVDYLELLRKQ